MGWSMDGLTPGVEAHLKRMDALERVEAEREAAERAERAQDRLEAWAFSRMMQMSAAGQPYDAGDWSTLLESPDVMAERVFGHQDREAARLERRTLIESGLLADLGPRFAGDEAAQSSGPAGTSTVSPGGASATSPVAARARWALHRLAKRSDSCMCKSCVRVRSERAKGRTDG
jgi:hypothetical protein